MSAAPFDGLLETIKAALATAARTPKRLAACMISIADAFLSLHITLQ